MVMMPISMNDEDCQSIDDDEGEVHFDLYETERENEVALLYKGHDGFIRLLKELVPVLKEPLVIRAFLSSILPRVIVYEWRADPATSEVSVGLKDVALSEAQEALGLPNSPSSRTPHPSIKVRVGAVEADIDVLIAPLIQLLWETGIETVMSCQGEENGYVWLQFPTSHDCVCFLNAVGKFEHGIDCLYNRMNQWCRTSLYSLDWEYDVDVIDHALELDAVEADSAQHEGQCDFVLSFNVRFPRQDLDVVTKRMHEYAQELKDG